MTTDDLLTELDCRGVELFLDGDHLRFRAPSGALSPDLRAAIAERRPAIIEALRPTPTATDRHLEPCGGCDPGDWRDDLPAAGRIRTTCRRCGRFIGYRPAELVGQ